MERHDAGGEKKMQQETLKKWSRGGIPCCSRDKSHSGFTGDVHLDNVRASNGGSDDGGERCWFG